MDLKMQILCHGISASPYRCLPNLFLKALNGDDSPVCGGSVFQYLTVFSIRQWGFVFYLSFHGSENMVPFCRIW